MIAQQINKEGAMSNIKNVTVTIIFDGAALNRDEKIGGNILSIKKLNINGEVRSFIGKPAIRHYLYQTLYRQDPHTWSPAPVAERGSGDRKTLQFDLTRADIITCPELDVFGYMFTIEGERSLTRKAPLGITKAISLYSYEADLAFYANHDLVTRRRKEGYIEIMPGLYNKEEHTSFYKLSFTLDTFIIGQDTWVIEQEPSIEEGRLSIQISDSDKKLLDGSQNNGTAWKLPDGAGTLKWGKINAEKFFLTFTVSEDKRKERIKTLLEAIKNGLYAQSSGEANTIVPLFLIAGAVKVPSPVFHSYIDVKKEDGQWQVIGVGDGLKNSWLEKNDNDPIVYIQDCERLRVDSALKSGRDNWEDFLSKVGLK